MMRTLCRTLLTTLLAGGLGAAFGSAITVVSATSPAAGQSEAFRIVKNAAEYEFAESMTFRIDAESTAGVPIESVVLRYTIGQENPRNRRIPVFTPGTTISAVHEETLARGGIPPTSEVAWWWQLEDAKGNVWDTPVQTVRYLDQRFKWQSTDGADVRVWWYKEDKAFANRLAESARTALSALQGTFGAMPDRRIEIVAYLSQDDLRPALLDRGGVYESRLATLGARVAPDVLLLDAGNTTNGGASASLDQVMAHELSHVVLNLRFKHDYLGAPLWLDEGLAMYAEGDLEGEENAVLDEALKDDMLMSLRSLTTFPGQADLVTLAYAESRDVVDFLIESKGKPAFQAFLDALAGGDQTVDEALTKAYGYDQLTLYQAYRAHRGLPPAVPEAALTAAGQRREAGSSKPNGLSGPCGSAGLVLPALGLVWWQRRRVADPRGD